MRMFMLKSEYDSSTDNRIWRSLEGVRQAASKSLSGGEVVWESPWSNWSKGPASQQKRYIVAIPGYSNRPFVYEQTISAHEVEE